MVPATGRAKAIDSWRASLREPLAWRTGERRGRVRRGRKDWPRREGGGEARGALRRTPQEPRCQGTCTELSTPNQLKESMLRAKRAGRVDPDDVPRPGGDNAEGALCDEGGGRPAGEGRLRDAGGGSGRFHGADGRPGPYPRLRAKRTHNGGLPYGRRRALPNRRMTGSGQN